MSYENPWLYQGNAVDTGGLDDYSTCSEQKTC